MTFYFTGDNSSLNTALLEEMASTTAGNFGLGLSPNTMLRKI